MARTSYSIPASLDRSIFDSEINLSGKHMNVRPRPVKVIFFFLGSLLLMGWALWVSPLKTANFGLLVLLAIWWIAVTIYMGGYSKTKEMRSARLLPLIDYLPKKSRHVRTRTDSKPGAFYSIVGITDVDPVSGLISYSDGTVGQAYSVVGSASRLLFDEDRNAILDRNDRFYRKMEAGVEWIFVTTKEPQRVYSQIANLERRKMSLDKEAHDPELLALADEQYETLRSYVGSSFFSIHQYLFIRAGNEEALRAAHNLLDNEVADSSLVFKQVSMLTSDETLDLLRTIYGPVTVGAAGQAA